MEYTLDTEGNRLAEKTYDSSDTLKRQLEPDLRPLQPPGYQSTETHDQRDYDYAADGTLDQLTEGNGTVTDYGYDDLKRLTRTVQDTGGSDPATADATSTYQYDAGDRLTQVTDADGHVTSYSYDDLGNRLSQTSPDSGTTTYTVRQRRQPQDPDRRPRRHGQLQLRCAQSPDRHRLPGHGRGCGLSVRHRHQPRGPVELVHGPVRQDAVFLQRARRHQAGAADGERARCTRRSTATTAAGG